MFGIIEAVNDFMNDVVIGTIADLVVKAIEKVDAIVHLKRTIGDEIGHLKARQITLDELKEEVSSNE